MDFLELTKKRFSARNYKSDKVEQDKIDYIIECARLAPSAEIISRGISWS